MLLYYNQSLNFYCPPFSVWLEDIFIGLVLNYILLIFGCFKYLIIINLFRHASCHFRNIHNRPKMVFRTN